jgi:hypothetical protein
MATILLILISVAQTVVPAGDETWKAPIGIPKPTFGIDETYRMYDSETNRNPALTYYAGDSGGYYTHYVDSSDEKATDSGNDYGTKERPRKSVPRTLEKGSVVEIHNSAGGTWLAKRVTTNGTEDMPIFVRGVDSPLVTKDGYLIRGCYSIWEGIKIYEGGFSIRQADGSGIGHHIAVRNCESYGSGEVRSHAGVGVDGVESEKFHHIVFYNNHIHHGGDCNYPEENDNHGIVVGDYCQYIWALNNHVHHMGGDSIQLSHGANYTTDHVYIGGNTFHDDREDAVDIKQANHVIVSQNEMYSYKPATSSGGGACVVHYDPCNIYWLYNKIHDVNFGIVSTGSFEQYFIGNLIYNVHGGLAGHSASSPYRRGIGIKWYNTGNTYVVNNILYDCEVGIGADILSYPTTIANNIFCNVGRDGPGYHLSIQGKGLSSSRVINSIFYQSNGSVKIFWGGACDFSEFKSDPVKSKGCIEADPLFVDPANGVFDLQSTSPFLKMEISEEAEEIYDRFLELYGIDLRSDIESHARDWIDIKDISPSPDTLKEETEEGDNENSELSAESSDESNTHEEEADKSPSAKRDKRRIISLKMKRSFTTKKIFDRYKELYNSHRRFMKKREYYE